MLSVCMVKPSVMIIKLTNVLKFLLFLKKFVNLFSGQPPLLGSLICSSEILPYSKAGVTFFLNKSQCLQIYNLGENKHPGSLVNREH